MSGVDQIDEAAAIVIGATSRSSLPEAIAWLAEEHPMPLGTNWPRLLRAVVVVVNDSEMHGRALRRVTREVTSSDVDTAKILFAAAEIPSPETFKTALDELVSRSHGGTLGSLTPRGVLRAQYANSRAIETLCYVAGIGYGDAKKWFASGETWTIEAISALLSYLDDLVESRLPAVIPNTEVARAIELISDPLGWSGLDELRTDGVPYELLLAQRAVGGTWLQHKNRTSSFANVAAADFVCKELEKCGILYRRSSTVGGDARQVDLQALSGVADKRVGVVALDRNETPTFAIAFSAANDGGTARANGDGLLQIPLTGLPFAVVLTGQGWANRPETDRLARRYAGRLFTERSVDELVDCVQEVTG